MAGFMDMFSGGDGGSSGNSGNSGNSGMFGGMFGGGDVYGDLLTDEQKQRMQQQTMMTMAAKLLQAGGPSATPTNLGQALGGAFLSGQEAYGKAGQNAVQGMLTKQKIEEYRSEQKRKEALNAMISGGMQGSEPTQMQTPDPGNITLGAMPQSSAASMPGMQQGGMQPGMPGMQTGMPGMQTGMPGQTSNGMFGLNAQQAKLFPLLPATDQQKMLVEAASQRETFSNPITEMGPGGNPVQVVYGTNGSRRVVPGATPFNKPTSGIQEYEYAVNNHKYAGTFQQFQKEMAKAGASSNVVSIPEGMSPLNKAVDEKFAQVYVDWKAGGSVSAARNMTQIGGVLQAIQSGQKVSGPVLGLIPGFVQAFTNPNALDAQETVAGVVQLSMREIMGPQFTEKEGVAMIARAFNPQLSAEVNARRLAMLMEQLQGQSLAKQSMVDYVDANKTLAGYKGPQVDAGLFYRNVMSRLESDGAGKDIGSYFIPTNKD
jgi:hypothetical protein